MVFPDSLKKEGISGIVTVSYTITKEGKVENVKLIRGIHPVCDSEAIRVTQLLTGWQPANKMGKSINTNVLMPIEFRNEYNPDNKQPVIVTGILTDHYTGKPIEGSLNRGYQHWYDNRRRW
jgi:TonB family protein